jgi:hypothetical protein
MKGTVRYHADLGGVDVDEAGAIHRTVAGSGSAETAARSDHTHAATGDVVGPASGTDNAVVRFDGATGKLVQDSTVVVGDTGNLSGVGTIASGAITSTGASALGSLALTTDLPVTEGGTGASTAAAARTNLGAQASDAELSAIAGLASAADTAPYFTGSGTAALATLTAFGRSLIDDADAAAARVTINTGTMLSATTSAVSVASTTTPTALGTTYQFPANYLTNGKQIRITEFGTYGTAGAAPNLTVDFRLGGSLIGTSAATALGAGLTGRGWQAYMQFFMNTSTQVVCRGIGFFGGSPNLMDILNSSLTIDPTLALTLEIFVTWSASSASNAIVGRGLVVEALN